MNCSASKQHTFPIIKAESIERETFEFIQAAMKSKNQFVRRYAYALLLDMIRPEFPTNSLRDLFTCYSSKNISNDLIQQIYPCVVLKIADKQTLTNLNYAVNEFCEDNNFQTFYETVLTRNIIIDIMCPPLEIYPYFRTRCSGKYIPRIFVDDNGSCYDILGIKLDDYEYNSYTNLLSEIASGFKFKIPMHSFVASLKDLFQSVCSISFVYGKLASKLNIAKDIEKKFQTLWSCNEENKLLGYDLHAKKVMKFKKQHTIYYDTLRHLMQVDYSEFTINE